MKKEFWRGVRGNRFLAGLGVILAQVELHAKINSLDIKE